MKRNAGISSIAVLSVTSVTLSVMLCGQPARCALPSTEVGAADATPFREHPLQLTLTVPTLNWVWLLASYGNDSAKLDNFEMATPGVNVSVEYDLLRHLSIGGTVSYFYLHSQNLHFTPDVHYFRYGAVAKALIPIKEIIQLYFGVQFGGTAAIVIDSEYERDDYRHGAAGHGVLGLAGLRWHIRNWGIQLEYAGGMDKFDHRNLSGELYTFTNLNLGAFVRF